MSAFLLKKITHPNILISVENLVNDSGWREQALQIFNCFTIFDEQQTIMVFEDSMAVVTPISVLVLLQVRILLF